MMTFNLLSVQNIAVNFSKISGRIFILALNSRLLFDRTKSYALSTEILEFSHDVFLKIYQTITRVLRHVSKKSLKLHLSLDFCK